MHLRALAAFGLASTLAFSHHLGGQTASPAHATLPDASIPDPNEEGVYKVGGDVRPPRLIYSVDPEFTERARKKKFSGNVTVALIVDVSGVPRNVRVQKGVGMGLDEKAVEAVMQYRFKPAMLGDKPVPVQMFIDVNFQIF